jgi:hypothetical protein
VAACGGDPRIDRLTALTDDHNVVDPSVAQWTKNILPWRWK